MTKKNRRQSPLLLSSLLFCIGAGLLAAGDAFGVRPVYQDTPLHTIGALVFWIPHAIVETWFDANDQRGIGVMIHMRYTADAASNSWQSLLFGTAAMLLGIAPMIEQDNKRTASALKLSSGILLMISVICMMPCCTPYQQGGADYDDDDEDDDTYEADEDYEEADGIHNSKHRNGGSKHGYQSNHNHHYVNSGGVNCATCCDSLGNVLYVAACCLTCAGAYHQHRHLETSPESGALLQDDATMVFLLAGVVYVFGDFVRICCLSSRPTPSFEADTQV